MTSRAEYYVSRMVPSPREDREYFVVTKFTDEHGVEPANQYTVWWDLKQDIMFCDCPNRRRGAHIDDKHGKLVRAWLADGEKPEAMIIPQLDL